MRVRACVRVRRGVASLAPASGFPRGPEVPWKGPLWQARPGQARPGVGGGGASQDSPLPTLPLQGAARGNGGRRAGEAQGPS